MTSGKTIIEVGCNIPEAWWVVAGFAAIILLAVVFMYRLLPVRYRWTVVLLPLVTFVTTPFLIRRIIEAIINRGGGDVYFCTHFFDWPRYYPSVLAFVVAGFLAQYSRRAVA